MTKTKEELITLKMEKEVMNKNNNELTDENLQQVAGGDLESENNWTITIKCGYALSNISNTTFTLQVSPDNTILEVKQMIKTNKDVDVGAQRLIFMGKELNDSNTLSSVGVANGSLMNLIIRSHY